MISQVGKSDRLHERLAGLEERHAALARESDLAVARAAEEQGLRIRAAKLRTERPLTGRVAGFVALALAVTFSMTYDDGWSFGSFLAFAFSYFVGFVAVWATSLDTKEPAPPPLELSVHFVLAFITQLVSVFCPPVLPLLALVLFSGLMAACWDALSWHLGISDRAQELAEINGQISELRSECRDVASLGEEIKRVDAQRRQLRQKLKRYEAEQARQQQQSREQQRRERAAAERLRDEAKRAAELAVYRARASFVRQWSERRGELREQLSLLQELPQHADLSPFHPIVFARAKRDYWPRLGIKPAFGGSDEGLKRQSELRLELGELFAQASPMLNGRYPIEAFNHDLTRLLIESPVVVEPVGKQTTAGYGLITPSGSVLSVQRCPCLSQSPDRVPLHFAEVLFAVFVHESARQRYAELRNREPQLFDTLVCPRDFQRLTEEILVDWRSPRTAGSQISELLARAEALLPEDLAPVRDELDSASEVRLRREALDSLRLHYAGYAKLIEDDYPPEALCELIESELTDGLSLGELQLRVERQMNILDNRVARREVRVLFDEHSEFLGRYLPEDEFRQELAAVPLELPRAGYLAEMDQLRSRLARYLTSLQSTYSRQLDEELADSQRVREREGYERDRSNVQAKYLSLLEGRRRPDDTDEQIQQQVEQFMEQWSVDNPPPA